MQYHLSATKLTEKLKMMTLSEKGEIGSLTGEYKSVTAGTTLLKVLNVLIDAEQSSHPYRLAGCLKNSTY